MEKERKKIVIVFNFRKGWMGGVIYVINLINALNYLDEDQKPEIIVVYNQELKEFIKELKYPYLQCVKWNFPPFWKGYLGSWLTGTNQFVDEIIRKYRPIGIYPMNDWPWSHMRSSFPEVKVVAWFPDLQHKVYPNFFSRFQWWMREIRLRILLRNAGDLVVSSLDVKNHFHRYYAIREALRMSVLHFASIVDSNSLISFDDLRAKYALPEQFFMVSNQFHNHKNHPVILNALALLKHNSAIHFVFTGKLENPGNELYVSRIRALIKQHSLDRQISFLGVISREEQLTLMRNARAIVQPSLFEGWSTVIEDAISLGVPVIAADLPVNQEQLGDTGYYFSPHDAQGLAGILEQFPTVRPVPKYQPYEERLKTFAETFISIFAANDGIKS